MIRVIFSALVFMASSGLLFAQEDGVEVKHNGITHTIQVGDTVHLGYGSNPYGSFMYINHGPNEQMSKDFGGKEVYVKSIKYIKLKDAYRITMKAPKAWVFYTDGILQAVEKKEIRGFNQTMFGE